jgi:hypothetical protein
MTTTQTGQLSPKLQTIANKVKALQQLKDESGFQTKKTVRELLSPLSPDELSQVAQAIYSE